MLRDALKKCNKCYIRGGGLVGQNVTFFSFLEGVPNGWICIKSITSLIPFSFLFGPLHYYKWDHQSRSPQMIFFISECCLSSRQVSIQRLCSSFYALIIPSTEADIFWILIYHGAGIDINRPTVVQRFVWSAYKIFYKSW